MVPAAAIRSVDGRTGVFRIVEGRARFQPVKTGPQADGQVEVLEGLAGGERLISSSSGEIREGDKVRVEGEKS
jgi:multidrug efflux pump subunit AcrA (membrane-fusion protein)